MSCSRWRPTHMCARSKSQPRLTVDSTGPCLWPCTTLDSNFVAEHKIEICCAGYGLPGLHLAA